jgi:hypothetical protein
LFISPGGRHRRGGELAATPDSPLPDARRSMFASAGATKEVWHGDEGLKAHVRGGRLVVDEPTSLPEGTELDLVAATDADDLDDTERAALHTALHAAWERTRRGDTRPAGDLIARLRRTP